MERGLDELKAYTLVSQGSSLLSNICDTSWLTMFTLAPESTKNLHVIALTFNDTKGALPLVAESNVNVYSSSELDGGECGVVSLFT